MNLLLFYSKPCFKSSESAVSPLAVSPLAAAKPCGPLADNADNQFQAEDCGKEDSRLEQEIPE